MPLFPVRIKGNISPLTIKANNEADARAQAEQMFSGSEIETVGFPYADPEDYFDEDIMAD